MLRAALTALLLLGSTLPALAARIDIDDPSVLGSLLFRDVIWGPTDYENAFVDVRYEGGVYSYIYAVSSSPYFPGTLCCEAHMVSYAVTGHPLEDTWGAINGSAADWTPDPNPSGYFDTATVESISPLHDGFAVVSSPGTGQFAVVYMQSHHPPSRQGTLTYTGRVRDHDHGGIVIVDSFQRGDVLAPIPEPGSIMLLGSGSWVSMLRCAGGAAALPWSAEKLRRCRRLNLRLGCHRTRRHPEQNPSRRHRRFRGHDDARGPHEEIFRLLRMELVTLDARKAALTVELSERMLPSPSSTDGGGLPGQSDVANGLPRRWGFVGTRRRTTSGRHACAGGLSS